MSRLEEMKDRYDKADIIEHLEGIDIIAISVEDKDFLFQQAEEKHRLEECLKSVQEELHYALNTDKDYDIKWYFVGNANRIIEEALEGEANG